MTAGIRWRLESQPKRPSLTGKAHIATDGGWTLCGMLVGHQAVNVDEADCKLCLALAAAEGVQPLHNSGEVAA